MKFKTKYDSYNINTLPKGCKYCVRGEKLVLFISGICSRACWYCSLSDKRKNKDVICFNERIAKKNSELYKEIKESNASSMGITGGDPLLYLNRTISYAKFAKQKFGKSFHIHIYLPTKLITKDKIKKLSKYIDEIRFNPEYTIKSNELLLKNDIEKIKIASLFYKKENIGIELPMIPNRKEDFLKMILELKDIIGFVNLNEFELSETNMDKVTKKYKLNEGGYTIKNSIKSGIWIINEIKKNKEINKIKVHLCTANLKNNYQFKNRLKLHKVLPFGDKTKEGMVKYLVTNTKPKIIQNPKNKKTYFYDKEKKRYNLSESLAKELIKNKQKIFLIEEFPTYDRIEVEVQELN